MKWERFRRKNLGEDFFTAMPFSKVKLRKPLPDFSSTEIIFRIISVVYIKSPCYLKLSETIIDFL